MYRSFAPDEQDAASYVVAGIKLQKKISAEQRKSEYRHWDGHNKSPLNDTVLGE